MLAVIIVLLTRAVSVHWFQLMLIQGDSMYPTYKNFQIVGLQKCFDSNDISEGTVVAFKCENLNCVLIKRIAAVPGQTITVKQKTLFVNDLPSRFFPKDAFQNSGLLNEKIRIDEGEYFVIGDNCEKSIDSRFTEVGNVKKENIIGIVM